MFLSSIVTCSALICEENFFCCAYFHCVPLSDSFEPTVMCSDWVIHMPLLTSLQILTQLFPRARPWKCHALAAWRPFSLQPCFAEIRILLLLLHQCSREWDRPLRTFYGQRLTLSAKFVNWVSHLWIETSWMILDLAQKNISEPASYIFFFILFRGLDDLGCKTVLNLEIYLAVYHTTPKDSFHVQYVNAQWISDLSLYSAFIIIEISESCGK